MLNLDERVNCFTLELYDNSDTLDFNNIINIIKSSSFYSCKWYYILHDKDIKNKNTGELFKPHYHLLVKLENAISIKNIIKSLINERGSEKAIVDDFSIVKSFKGCVRYLIHYDDKDKYQYCLNDIQTNDKNLSYYFNDNTIIDNFKLLYYVISKYNITSFKDLIEYCINNNDIILMQYIQDNAYLVNCILRG